MNSLLFQMFQFWFIDKNIKLLLKFFSTSFYITQILFIFSSCFSNIGNVNELVHNVSVLMLLVVNVFLVLGKYWPQWFWIFSCPRKNIWHEIWPLHSDKKNSYFLVRSVGPDLLKHLVFCLLFFQLFSFSFYPPLPLFQLLVFQNCFFISFWGKLIFCEFSRYKISFIWDILGFLDSKAVSKVLINRENEVVWVTVLYGTV